MTKPTLQQSHGPAYTRIYAIGAARGANLVPNDDLVGPINSSDEWIQQRTGIITRARAGADVAAIDLATDAAREAIEKSGVAPELIDLVIIATISNVQQTPSMAAVVADRVGANPAAAYDTNAACAGYAYAIAQADALIRTGGRALRARDRRREALRTSSTRPTGRSRSCSATAPGAVVIGPSDFPGIARTIWGSDGSKADAVGMNAHPHRVPRRRLRVADPPPGGPDGLPVGGVGHGEGRQAGAGCRRHHRGGSRRLHPAPGQHAHRRRVREAAEAARFRRRSPATSRRPATRRPRRSRSPTHRLLEEHPELSGGLALQIGFGAGLVFGAQVVVLP